MVRGGKRDAQRVERELIDELEAGITRGEARLTLERYLTELWLPHVRLQREPRTFERYAGSVRQHIAPALGRSRLNHVAPAAIQRLWDRMLRSGRSPKTVRDTRGVLHKALNDSVRWQLITRNPVAATTAPSVPRRKYRVLGRDETLRLFEVARDRPIEPILHVAVMCGLRQGEILGLQWADVDLDTGILRVVGALKPRAGGGVVYGTTKQDRVHAMDLGASVVAVLRCHYEWQTVVREWMEKSDGDQGYVFTHEDGRPIHPQTLRKWWRKLLVDAQIAQPWPRFHDLRHTQGTLLLQLGVHPKVVAERLGHATPEITLRLYSHVVQGLQQQAADDLDQ